ncbi:hypothetical protein ACC704_38195 [Rhizobium johnstonii]
MMACSRIDYSPLATAAGEATKRKSISLYLDDDVLKKIFQV